MNRIAGLAMAVVLLGPFAFAQSSSVRVAASLERQVKELEKQWTELRSTDPAGWDKFKASTVLGAQEALAKFGYGTVFTAVLDEKTKVALRSYQARNGLPATGDVDVRTWIRLQEDRSALER